MKTFVFLLALGYVSSEKLNLAYLPPPGSQFSGGQPGDIQVPLEFPKETYSTTLRPQTGDNRGLSPEDYKPTIGIDRVPGIPVSGIVTPGSSSFSQNGPRVPTTTVSYAFTQTTTHPPTEGFETTIGPQIGGFPTTDIFNNLPSQEPGFNFDGNVAQNQPGYQQTVNQFGQPTLSPTSEPAFNNLPSQGPGLLDNGNINQFGQPALAPTSGPVSQFTGSPNGQQFIGQNRPGPQQIFNQQQPSYQQPISGNLSGSLTPAQQNFYRNQSLPGHLGIGNQPGYVPSTNSPQAFSSTSRPYGSILGDSISNIPGANLPQSGFPQQVQINGYQPGTNVQPSQIPGQQQFVDRQMINQQFPGSQLPGQVGGFENRLPSSTVAPTYTPSFPNQQISGISGTEYNDNSSGIQQYPEFQGVSRDRQSAYQPSSTVSPTFMPGIPNQDYPAGTSVLPGGGQQYPTSATPGAYSTPSYPAVQANAASSVYRPRPERPQSEADRNAVILNYDNIITPEGFAYSFDTSNGIHADESGTATDGVKAKGSYSYIGDDGKQYSVVYTADENGFRPRGDHLPTPPPVPEAIQRVIEQAQRDKEAGIIDDGSYDVDKYGHKKYQGAMGRRPQFTDKDFSNGADIPEDAVIDGKVQQTKQRFGPQVSQKRPTASTEESDFDDGNQEPGLTDEQRTVIKENKKTGQVSTQRPYEVTYTDSQDNEGGDLEGILDENQSFEEQPTNRPFVEGTSRRPVNQGVKKQYNSATNVPGSEETTFRGGDRRRPIDRIPSSQSIGTQGFSDNREPEYNNNRFINKGYSRRPVNDEDNLYENEESDDENETSSQQPSTLGPIRRPGSNVGAENVKTESQQTYDKFGRPISRIPSRRPVSNKNRLETEPELEENYNRQRDDSKKPYYKPSTYLPEEPQTVTDEYILNEYATRAPSKIRPDGVKTVNQFVPIGTRRRPSAPGLNGSAMIDKGVQYQPENNNGYIDSNVDGDLESQDHDDRRVSSGGIPSKTSSDRYEESDLEPEDFVSIQENRSGKPKFPPSNNYEGARGRPQPSKTNVNNDRTQDSGNRRFNVARPGTKFGQKINRPAYDQQSSIDNNNENRPFNSSGYQYIPPQRKFEEDGVQRFPAAGTRVTGTTARPITGRPTPSNIFYDDKNRVSSSRPFMTPNVSRIGTENDEDRDQYNEESDSQYPDSGTTPDQVYGDDEITSTGPVRYTSTTGRPIFQTSKRPQYYDQTQNVPGKQRVPQRGRPSQGSDNRYYEGTKRPLGYASSTTPMPSSRPQVSSSRPLRPGQQDQTYYTNDVNDNKAPGKGFVSSTTPFPSESPNVEGSYQQNNIGPEYQTTYRPMETIRPTSGYKDRLNAQRLPTVGPSGTSINIAPSVSKTQYQENLPSTTYRPNYTINGQLSSTARPGIQVDGYGRPISTPGSGQSIQEYLPGGQRQPSSTVRPGGVDMYGRPNRPGYGTTTEEFIPGDLNAPSSTTAPGVQVDAFGRPIRPEAATPGQYVPSSTASPSVLVDTFGRPINKPISGAIQEYGPSSQVQPSSTARPGAFDAYGRPISAPGSTPQEYTPAFASGSEPGIIGDRVNGQFLPGVPSTVQPGYQSTSVGPQGQNSVTVSPGNQFRGNQRYQPGGFTNQPGSFTNQPGSYTNQPGWSQGVSSTFRPTTERIIGEDFSGPKQQQKFDPERGYYY